MSQEPPNKKSTGAETGGIGAPGDTSGAPRWTESLRKMYDSVVDEPIPDNFKDLIAQLDEGSSSGTDGKTK